MFSTQRYFLRDAESERLAESSYRRERITRKKETPDAQVRRRIRPPLRDGDLRPPRRHRVHRRRDGREMGA
ncbi:MAG: hypothetical protein B7Z74_09405, partial [Deltaproteobacteria bacterium 21-66-5]